MINSEYFLKEREEGRKKGRREAKETGYKPYLISLELF